MIAGERDPVVLARCQGSYAQKNRPAGGRPPRNFKRHPAILCRPGDDHLDFYGPLHRHLSAEICSRPPLLSPSVALLSSIRAAPVTTAQVIVAETGGDMGRFPTAGAPVRLGQEWRPPATSPAGKRRPAGTRAGCTVASPRPRRGGPGRFADQGKLTTRPSTRAPARTKGQPNKRAPVARRSTPCRDRLAPARTGASTKTP